MNMVICYCFQSLMLGSKKLLEFYILRQMGNGPKIVQKMNFSAQEIPIKCVKIPPQMFSKYLSLTGYHAFIIDILAIFINLRFKNKIYIIFTR